jgi:hypothetical protein
MKQISHAFLWRGLFDILLDCFELPLLKSLSYEKALMARTLCESVLGCAPHPVVPLKYSPCARLLSYSVELQYIVNKSKPPITYRLSNNFCNSVYSPRKSKTLKRKVIAFLGQSNSICRNLSHYLDSRLDG